VIQIRRHALVRYSPEAMFDLVDDVEAYPTRFPWCADARIVANEGGGVRVARLDLRFAGLTQSFTTRNTAERPHRLHMHLVEGPLRSLDGEFTFTPLGGASSGPPGRTGSGPAQALLEQAAGGDTEQLPASRSPIGCKIALALDFEYAGLIAGTALRLGFQGLASRLVDDFVRAAAKTYG
jgi:ribosome-associated toxin RatA of RatAB toxin-antitoxin module